MAKESMITRTIKTTTTDILCLDVDSGEACNRSFVLPRVPKKEKEILITVLLAMGFSTLFTLVPLLKQVSAGISIVICTVAAAAVCAALFPIPDEKEAEA